MQQPVIFVIGRRKFAGSRDSRMFDLSSESERSAIGHAKPFIVLRAILSLWRDSQLHASVIRGLPGRRMGDLF
jgi:hypothetical protein